MESIVNRIESMLNERQNFVNCSDTCKNKKTKCTECINHAWRTGTDFIYYEVE